jgi:hypothetical protein
MRRKRLLIGTPESADMNTVAYSPANTDGNTAQKVVLKKDQSYYYDSSENNDLSVKVVNTLASNILNNKDKSENSETQVSISSSERGAL